MGSRFPVTQHSTTSRKKRAATQVIAVQPEARQDDKRASPVSMPNDPLWGMAIASAILLALLAGLIASS